MLCNLQCFKSKCEERTSIGSASLIERIKSSDVKRNVAYGSKRGWTNVTVELKNVKEASKYI